ncbi:Imm51 family immunity protein [Catellatospora sp. KI3]|uniref:Imm51 family immunity protein n=1 Tax=Catellatospora sp. KI3 TaxID=3041620 RepID=UPI002482D896|nr:Imm51 family immunity protein [Catellatospora sp. KI3]MDI1462420.1 Imm51 family immunity protein [Catellatospora sp. KI3]
MSSNHDFAPCRLMESESGEYSLIFDDFDDHVDIFDEQGWEGNGYAWEGVVQVMLAERVPEILDQIEFDSETALFSVTARSEDALLEVAAVIREAIGDADVLADAIARAEEQGLLD